MRYFESTSFNFFYRPCGITNNIEEEKIFVPQKESCLFRVVFAFLITFLGSQTITSQTSGVDSAKAQMLYNKAAHFNENNTDSAIHYIEKCIAFVKDKKLSRIEVTALGFYGHLSESIGRVARADSLYNVAITLSKKYSDYKLLSSNYLNLGILYYRSGEFKKALEYDLMSLETDSLLKSKRSPGKIYQNIGNVYNALANYTLALDYFYKSIREFQKDSVFVGLGGSYCNIGSIYDSQNEFDKAIKSYRTALSYLRKTTNVGFIINTNANLGIALGHKGLHDSALFYYSLALKDAQKIKNPYVEASCLSNIAVTYVQQKKFKSAQEYLLKAQAISESLGDSSSLSEIKINLGDCYLKTGDCKTAIENFYQGYLIAKNIGENEFVIHALHGLFDGYNANKQFKEAAFYLDKCFNLKDSIFNLENSKQLSDLQTDFEVEKKEAELKAEQEKKDAVTLEEKKRQTVILWAVSGFALLGLVLASVIFKSLRSHKMKNRIITQQKHLVEEKQKEILDSIRYARRIQNALITNEKYIEKSLKKFKA